MRVPHSAPVMSFSRAVEPLQAENSVERAVTMFSEQGVAVLPVLDGETLLGLLHQQTLLELLGLPERWANDIRGLVHTNHPTVTALDTGSAALRLISDDLLDGLPIVGRDNRYVGMIYPASFLAVQFEGTKVHLGMTGGMATPFGVYLTDGAHFGGVHPVALAATGAVLMLYTLVAQIIVYFVALNAKVPAKFEGPFETVLALTIFLILMRAFPIAGIHAAEHMTVHAIERGEPLVPQAVSRMPRVHPRCGTNLAAGLGIFMSIAGGSRFEDGRVLIAALATLFFWKPVGSFMQYWFTTRPPSAKHILMGIKAGNELVQKNIQEPDISHTPWRRFLLSGIPMVIAGSSLMAGAIWLLSFVIPFLKNFV